MRLRCYVEFGNQRFRKKDATRAHPDNMPHLRILSIVGAGLYLPKALSLPTGAFLGRLQVSKYCMTYISNCILHEL